MRICKRPYDKTNLEDETMNTSTLTPHSIPPSLPVSRVSRGDASAREGEGKAQTGGINNGDKSGALGGPSLPAVIIAPPDKPYPPG
jgi:hypothetical protein